MNAIHLAAFGNEPAAQNHPPNEKYGDFMKQTDSDREPRYPVDERFFRYGLLLDLERGSGLNRNRAGVNAFGKDVRKDDESGFDDKNVILDIITRSDAELMKNPFGSAFR